MRNKVATYSQWRSWIDVSSDRWYAWIIASAMLLIAFVLADRLILGISKLDQSAYAETTILWQLLVQTSSNAILVCGALVVMAAVAYWHKGLCAPWQTSAGLLPYRNMVMLCTVLLAWDFSSYSYNAYFAQSHLLDRLLLLCVAALVWLRPIFLLPFTVLCATIIWQFDVPIGGYSWAQHYMPLRLLVLFLCAFGLNQLLKVPFGSPFLLVALCLVASHYWVPGVGKYFLDWEKFNSVSYLIPNTYSNGWLAMFDIASINQITQLVANLDHAIRIFVLIIEWLVLIFLWHRKSAMVFLTTWIIFHFGVFTFSGIFFWKWIAVDCAFLYLLYRQMYQPSLTSIFNPVAFLLSIVMIAGGSLWFRPVNLAWLDVPINYSYRVIATTNTNQQLQLPPHFFSPYDYQFTLGAFGYLKDANHLGVVWGASPSAKVARALYSAKTSADILSIESQMGRSYYDPQRREAFLEFLQRFVNNRNQRNFNLLNVLGPPRQLWTFPKSPELPPATRITNLSVIEVLTFFDGKNYQTLRELPILQVQQSVGPIRRANKMP